MPAFNNYKELQELIRQYVYRDDERFVKDIPKFIALAERRIVSELKILELKFIDKISANAGDYQLKKPANWRNTDSLVFVSEPPNMIRRVMEPRLQVFVDSFTSAKGLPKYFCDVNDKLIQFAPNLLVNAGFVLTYYKNLTPLSDGDQTNEISTNFPELLLYGALRETAVYLGDDERRAVWEDYYGAAKQAALNEDLLRSSTGLMPNKH